MNNYWWPRFGFIGWKSKTPAGWYFCWVVYTSRPNKKRSSQPFPLFMRDSWTWPRQDNGVICWERSKCQQLLATALATHRVIGALPLLYWLTLPTRYGGGCVIWLFIGTILNYSFPADQPTGDKPRGFFLLKLLRSNTPKTTQSSFSCKLPTLRNNDRKVRTFSSPVFFYPLKSIEKQGLLLTVSFFNFLESRTFIWPSSPSKPSAMTRWSKPWRLSPPPMSNLPLRRGICSALLTRTSSEPEELHGKSLRRS